MTASKYILSFIGLITLFRECGPTKVVDRFEGYYAKDIRCRIWSPTGYKVGQKTSPMFDDLFIAAKKFNCTWIQSLSTQNGYPYPNGTYTGIIGKLQRNEADFAPITGRPDGLPFEHVLIGPILMEADVIIVTQRKYGQQITREILQFVYDFNPIVYKYLFLVILVVCILYTMTTYKSSWKEDPRLAVKAFFKHLWESFNLIIDQENFQSETNVRRILVLFFASFIFFMIYGIFLNKVGADLVAKTKGNNVDNIDYFLNNITHMKPCIGKNFFLINVLKASSKTSKLGKLWSLMEKEQNETVFDIQANSYDLTQEEQMVMMQEGNDLLWNLQTSRKALIIPKIMLEVVQRMGCSALPLNFSRLYVSKETFGHGTLNILMSHGIDPRLRKMIDYLGRTLQEVGVRKAMMSALIGNAAVMVPGVDFTYGLSAMECMAGKFPTKCRDSEDPALVKEYYKASDEVEAFLPYSMFHLNSCFVMLGIGLTASMTCCLLENFVYAFKKDWEPTRLVTKILILVTQEKNLRLKTSIDRIIFSKYSLPFICQLKSL